MIHTTLNEIRTHNVMCKSGWEKLLNHLGKTSADNEPLPLVTVLESNGVDDCYWCLRITPEFASEDISRTASRDAEYEELRQIITG